MCNFDDDSIRWWVPGNGRDNPTMIEPGIGPNISHRHVSRLEAPHATYEIRDADEEIEIAAVITGTTRVSADLVSNVMRTTGSSDRLPSALVIHIPDEAGDKQIYGITTTSYKNAIPHRECEYTYKTGKNKGLLCHSQHAFITNDTTFCKKHRQIYLKQQDANKLNETALNTCPFLTTSTCAQLRSFLKSINVNIQGNKSELVMKVFSFTNQDSFT